MTGAEPRGRAHPEGHGVDPLSIGFSLFLVAVGAILAWAVSYSVAGIDIKIVGAILIAVGLAGVALSLLFWSSFAPFARRPVAAEHTDIVDRP
jgi:hypothetical protein